MGYGGILVDGGLVDGGLVDGLTGKFAKYFRFLTILFLA